MLILYFFAPFLIFPAWLAVEMASSALQRRRERRWLARRNRKPVASCNALDWGLE